MGAKRFGAVDLVPATFASVAKGEEGFDSTIVVVFVNRSAEPKYVDLVYVLDVETPMVRPQDFLLFNKILPGGETLEVKGIALEQGFQLLVRANDGAVGAIAYGFKEEI